MEPILAFLSQPEVWISLLTLTLMEIVLGIDNVIFISIIAARLPKHLQARARNLGLLCALGFRVALLFMISWIASLTTPILTVLQFGFSGRDLILLGGGLFLIAKSTMEIHHKLEGDDGQGPKAAAPRFWAIVAQIVVLDIVFSFDSVVTAVGLAQDLPVMIAAVMISLVVMMLSAGQISAFITKHPTLKVLALSFLLLIGTLLVAEAFGFHVPKGYIYFAMAFSLLVETLNIRMGRGKRAE